MRIYTIIFIFFLGLTWSNAQDLDVYKVDKNSNFDIPNIPVGMTYQEFKTLSTNLRMQDMLVGMVLPGHVHFKIGEKKTGYYILGTRSLGYAIWGYMALKDESVLNIVFFDKLNFVNKTGTGDKIAAYSSVVLIVGSYLYDWIHGRYVLDEKQDSIRYKYAKKKTKVGVTAIQMGNNKIYPGLAVSYSF